MRIKNYSYIVKKKKQKKKKIYEEKIMILEKGKERTKKQGTKKTRGEERKQEACT